MDNGQKNKKILIFVGIILLLVVVVVFALKSCSGGKTSWNSDKAKEVVIEEKESEEGLDIEGPDDADENDVEGAVEFIEPDEAGNNSQTPSKNDGTEKDQSSNNDSNNKKEENADSNDNTVDDEENGNNGSQNGGLDEEATESKTGKYGTFF